MAASPELLAQLDLITDAKDPQQLRLLGQVLPMLRPESCGANEFQTLLGVLERFPLDDGFESFWSIVHFLEACEGYEPYLVASVLRNPADLTLTMLNRLLNAGSTQCGDTSYAAILESVAANTTFVPELRSRAVKFLEYQQRNSGSDA
jgi:hypothetical protein